MPLRKGSSRIVNIIKSVHSTLFVTPGPPSLPKEYFENVDDF